MIIFQRAKQTWCSALCRIPSSPSQVPRREGGSSGPCRMFRSPAARNEWNWRVSSRARAVESRDPGRWRRRNFAAHCHRLPGVVCSPRPSELAAGTVLNESMTANGNSWISRKPSETAVDGSSNARAETQRKQRQKTTQRNVIRQSWPNQAARECAPASKCESPACRSDHVDRERTSELQR